MEMKGIVVRGLEWESAGQYDEKTEETWLHIGQQKPLRSLILQGASTLTSTPSLTHVALTRVPPRAIHSWKLHSGME